MNKQYAALLLSALLGLAAAQSAPTKAPAPSPVPITPPEPPASANVTRNEPTALEFTPDKLSRLKVPAGFQLKVMATGLGNARSLLVMPDGGIYLSRMKSSDVWYLKDINGDGLIENVERKQVAQNMGTAHGMSVKDGKLYVAGNVNIWVMDMAQDGSLSVPRVFATDFPEAGQHGARGMHWGPDGYLYAAYGSPNNDAPTPSPEDATLLRISPDGKSREIYASGLRHTIGFGWQPGTGTLYGWDQGSDWHGDNIPPEEMNVLQRGKNYGWPFCYGDKNPDPYVNASGIPGGITKTDYCARTQGSVLNNTAHSAAIDMTFYTGSQFPSEYQNNVFTAFRGSWNRSEPSGYYIGRVSFDANNKPAAITPFVSGFVYQDGDTWKQFGRVAGVAQYTDGSLLFTDDQSGVLYRVIYTGSAK
ncbi:PQQ-dependent sugar dehydrogenase [Deinococcus sp.]|uniref:PQQ-dependent sugar dehydrogenase n=1 Tax=Deinococcus sp. TaxID=47478 RepID=UPI003B5BC681